MVIYTSRPFLAGGFPRAQERSIQYSAARLKMATTHMVGPVFCHGDASQSLLRKKRHGFQKGEEALPFGSTASQEKALSRCFLFIFSPGHPTPQFLLKRRFLL